MHLKWQGLWESTQVYGDYAVADLRNKNILNPPQQYLSPLFRWLHAYNPVTSMSSLFGVSITISGCLILKIWIPIPPIASHFLSLTSYSKLVHLLFLPGGLDLAWVRMGERGPKHQSCQLHRSSGAQTTWPQATTCPATPRIMHIGLLRIPWQWGRGIPSCGSSLAKEGKK